MHIKDFVHLSFSLYFSRFFPIFVDFPFFFPFFLSKLSKHENHLFLFLEKKKLNFRMKLSDRDKNVRDRLLGSLNSENIDDVFSVYRQEEFRHLAIPILAEKANHGHEKLHQIMAVDQEYDMMIQSALKLYTVDFEQVRIDLDMLKSALSKGTRTFDDPALFGRDANTMVRTLFSCLIKSDWSNDIFVCDEAKPFVVSTLCLCAPYLTEIISLRKLFISIASLPSGEELIEGTVLTVQSQSTITTVLDSAKTTIMVVFSRNMASLTKF